MLVWLDRHLCFGYPYWPIFFSLTLYMILSTIHILTCGLSVTCGSSVGFFWVLQFTDHHDINDILLKVALKRHNPNLILTFDVQLLLFYYFVFIYSKIQEDIEEENNKATVLSKKTKLNENVCVRCCRSFGIIFNRKQTCQGCKLYICKSCCMYDRESKGYICHNCAKDK